MSEFSRCVLCDRQFLTIGCEAVHQLQEHRTLMLGSVEDKNGVIRPRMEDLQRRHSSGEVDIITLNGSHTPFLFTLRDDQIAGDGRCGFVMNGRLYLGPTRSS